MKGNGICQSVVKEVREKPRMSFEERWQRAADIRHELQELLEMQELKKAEEWCRETDRLGAPRSAPLVRGMENSLQISDRREIGPARIQIPPIQVHDPNNDGVRMTYGNGDYAARTASYGRRGEHAMYREPAMYEDSGAYNEGAVLTERSMLGKRSLHDERVMFNERTGFDELGMYDRRGSAHYATGRSSYAPHTTAHTYTQRTPANTFLNQTQVTARNGFPRDLPSFYGSVGEWPRFISKYNRTTISCNCTDCENLERLQQCLKGTALDIVGHLLLFTCITCRFGRPDLIVDRTVEKIKMMAAPTQVW